MIAARQGHVEVVLFLLNQNSNSLWEKDRNDQTILHLAASTNQTAVIKAVLGEQAEADHLVNEVNMNTVGLDILH